MTRSELPKSEYNPYYHNYILALEESAGILDTLIEGRDAFLKVIDDVPDSKMEFAYAPGKWTLAELIAHIIDAERVFQYRALRFARGDKTALPGFEQDDYVLTCGANQRKKKDLLAEYEAVRESTIQLFKSFSDDALASIGTASGSPMSVRAQGFVICGHQAHHLRIIQERYL